MSVLFRLALNCLRGRYRRRRMSGTVVIFMRRLIKRADQLAFLEEEDGLASLAVIGSGRCGKVYRAQLPAEREGEEPRFVVIKRIRKLSGDGAPPQTNLSDEELCTAAYICHRNLFPLAAHVPRPDCHYLVYEYMKNGSLHDAFKATTTTTVLPWPARVRVAVGVASVLEYLHVSRPRLIYHGHLKTANVLLDDDMEPRVADFVFAKAMAGEDMHVAGTLGYMAPEYHQRFRSAAECDVYSFGVILAVLGTGKEPNDAFFTTVGVDIGLVSWLHREMHAGNHAEVIDPAIACPEYEEQIVLVLRVAVSCTAAEPRERPTAKEVRCMLSQLEGVIG